MIYWREQYERLHTYLLWRRKRKNYRRYGACHSCGRQRQKGVYHTIFKGGPTGELKILLQQPNITILRGKPNTPFTWNMTEEQKKEVTAYQTQQLKQAILHAQNSQCDLLILDEIMASYNLDLIDKDMLKEFILNKPEALELVLTGRDPADYMIEAADYVTEMKKIKHPFDAGIPARLGVEW